MGFWVNMTWGPGSNLSVFPLSIYYLLRSRKSCLDVIIYKNKQATVSTKMFALSTKLAMQYLTHTNSQ